MWSEQTGAFLTGLARDTVNGARVPAGAMCGLWVNVTGGPLFKPSASDSYAAFWVRDFSMSVDAGLFSSREIRHALRLTAATQAEQDRLMPSGSQVPFGSIADHIGFDGTPIYFPGTCNAMEQGGVWGARPSFDSPFYFIHMAWWHMMQSGDYGLLRMPIEGRSLIDRLDLAFHATPADPQSDLVFCGEEDRGANFGFMDAVFQTGHLLFASLLRAQAARELGDLMTWAEDHGRAVSYRGVVERLSGRFGAVFGSDDGLLRATTGISGQPDIWGTAYAVYLGLLAPAQELRACQALARCCLEDAVIWKGQARHVPPRADFSRQGSWERLVQPIPVGHYQNGAYWATPMGWICDAISRVAPRQAFELAEQLADYFMEEDRRAEGITGVPWECVHPREYHKEGGYMTSITCPLIAFRRLGWIAGE